MEIEGSSISCKNCVLEKRKSCVVNGKDCQMEAIYIVLNELDKKDKVISLMAQELINQPIRVMIGNEIFKFTNKEDTLKYFYNKIGG